MLIKIVNADFLGFQLNYSAFQFRCPYSKRAINQPLTCEFHVWKICKYQLGMVKYYKYNKSQTRHDLVIAVSTVLSIRV